MQVINKLRSANLYISGRPASVAARPGHTKAVGERIRICDRPPVYILDSPGIAVPYIKAAETDMDRETWCGRLVMGNELPQ